MVACHISNRKLTQGVTAFILSTDGRMCEKKSGGKYQLEIHLENVTKLP